jgi:hypothetical protein
VINESPAQSLSAGGEIYVGEPQRCAELNDPACPVAYREHVQQPTYLGRDRLGRLTVELIALWLRQTHTAELRLAITNTLLGTHILNVCQRV